MLKLKIIVSMLAVAGMVMLLMGGHIPHRFPGCHLYSGGSATGGLSHMEISHSGRPLLGPFRSMGTGS